MSVTFDIKEVSPGSWKQVFTRDGVEHLLCRGDHVVHVTKEAADACLGANRLKGRIKADELRIGR